MIERLPKASRRAPMESMPGWFARRREALPPADDIVRRAADGGRRPSLEGVPSRSSARRCGPRRSAPGNRRRSGCARRAARYGDRQPRGPKRTTIAASARDSRLPSVAPLRPSSPAASSGGRVEHGACGSSGPGHARLRRRDRPRGAWPFSACCARPATSRRDLRRRPPTRVLKISRVDYRELPDASRPDNILIHHFSIGSRASRIAYALPDRMVLVYHNITPPQYLVDVHPLLVQLCFLGRRELGFLRVALRPGTGRFGVQPPGARSRRLSAGRACSRSCQDFTHLAGPPDSRQGGVVRRRLGESPVRRPRSSRTSGSRT